MYTLQTYDIGDIWGGQMTYDPSHLTEINEAITNFIANNQDPRAAIILGYMVVIGNESSTININYFYDGPAPPSNVFAAFMSIPSLSGTTKTQRYPQLLNVSGSSSLGLSSSNAVNSLPNMPSNNMTSFLD